MLSVTVSLQFRLRIGEAKAKVISSRSFIRSAMFDSELEWTVG